MQNNQDRLHCNERAPLACRTLKKKHTLSKHLPGWKIYSDKLFQNIQQCEVPENTYSVQTEICKEKCMWFLETIAKQIPFLFHLIVVHLHNIINSQCILVQKSQL